MSPAPESTLDPADAGRAVGGAGVPVRAWRCGGPRSTRAVRSTPCSRSTRPPTGTRSARPPPLFEVPAQNIVYADVDGNIGYQSPGRIPVRGKGDGRWPAPGWDPAYDWTGYIPFAELPTVLNPPEGWIVTANQAVVGPQYQHLLTTTGRTATAASASWT